MYTNPNHGKFNWDNENNNLVNNLQFLVDVQEYKVREPNKYHL